MEMRPQRGQRACANARLKKNAMAVVQENLLRIFAEPFKKRQIVAHTFSSSKASYARQ